MSDGRNAYFLISVVVVVAVPLPAGVVTVVDFDVSVVEGGVMVVLLDVSVDDGVVVTVVDVSAGFSFTTVVEDEEPDGDGVVETSVLQPARPRATSAARA